MGQEAAPSFVPGEYTKGYYSTVTLGLLLPGTRSSLGDFGNSFSTMHLKLVNTHGIRASRYLTMGVGTGIIFLDRGMALPLFTELRGDLCKGEITPTWYAQVGSSIPLYGKQEVTDWWGNVVQRDFKARGGLMYDIGIGIKVRGAGRSVSMITIGYQTQTITEKYRSWGTRYEETRQFQRLSIQLGWMF